MRSRYTPIKEVKKLLIEGWEIFTERGCEPARTLYFHIYNGDDRKRVHPNAIYSLIKTKFITGTEQKFGKYKIIKKKI